MEKRTFKTIPYNNLFINNYQLHIETRVDFKYTSKCSKLINLFKIMKNKITSIILAAGKGTRMNSSIPKPLHEIAGKSLIGHVIDGLTSVGVEDVIVVINKDQDALKKYLSETYPITRTAIQEEQLGTGNAVKVVFDQFDLSDSTGILIVFGDSPLLSQDTLDTLINSINERMETRRCDLHVWTTQTDP